MNSSTSRFSRCLVAGSLGLAAIALRATTIPDNLTVQGWVRADASDMSFATLGSGNYAVDLDYFNDARPDGSADTFVFTLNRASASWLWQSGTIGGTLYPAMRLDSNHQLVLYQSNSTTGGVTLMPASNAIKLGAHANGTLTADANGVITAGGGFAVAGGITNTNGTLTGGTSGLTLTAGGTNQSITLNSPGGDLIFNTNGSERMRIKSTGNVGIWTTSPTSRLSVEGGILSSDVRFKDSDGYVTYNLNSTDNGAGTSGALKFRTGDATERVRFDANGNVGIGTTSPGSRKLNVQTSDVSTDVGAEVVIARTSGTNYALSARAVGIGAANNNGIFTTAGGGTSNYGLRIFNVPAAQENYALFSDSAAQSYFQGNVGIGTIAPTTKLQVTGDNAEISLGRATGDGTPYVRLGFTTGFDTYWSTNATYNGTDWVYVNPSSFGGKASRIDQAWGAITFDTANGGINPITWTTRLKIDSSGNVGIGTTNPTHKLAVNGTIRANEVIVDTGWADYVFDENYRLAPLSEVEAHIQAKKHLPGVPSAAEVAAHGVSMGEMQATLLSKVEELTLHLIRLEKENAALRDRVVALEKQ